MFNQDDVVFTYTRAEAIADGVQVNLSELFPDLRQIYRGQTVFCTQRVWSLIESAVNNEAACNDLKGVLWDIAFMSIASPGKRAIANGVEFTVIITGADAKPDFFEDKQPIYRLQVLKGVTDINDPRPAVTWMFPGEN